MNWLVSISGVLIDYEKGTKLMSVIIAAYKGLKKFDDFGNTQLDGDVITVYGNSKCPRLGDGLEVGSQYFYKKGAWFGFGEKHVFNENINKLAKLVDYDCRLPGADEAGPFRELFWWGEQGTIGPVVSAKLAFDFMTWKTRARALKDDSFYEFYSDLRRMFDFAMHNGCVFRRRS